MKIATSLKFWDFFLYIPQNQCDNIYYKVPKIGMFISLWCQTFQTVEFFHFEINSNYSKGKMTTSPTLHNSLRGVLVLLKFEVNSQKLGVQAPQNFEFE